MAMNPSKDVATRFASAAEPLLEPLEREWTLLLEKTSNLARLVFVLERFAELKRMAANAGEEIAYQLCYGCEEILSRVLCDRIKDSQPAMQTVHDSFQALKNLIKTHAAGPQDPACASLIAGMFRILKAPVARLYPLEEDHTEETVPPGASAAGSPFAEEDHASSGVPESMEGTGVYREFVSDCGEHLDALEEKLLALETKPEDMDLIDGLFRRIHSIKGAAGCLALAGMEKLAHDTETLLDRCRKKTLNPTGEVIEVCLRSVDALRKLAQNLSVALETPAGESPTSRLVVYGPIRREIRRLLGQPDTATATPGAARMPLAPRLGDILVESGDITADDLEKALTLQDLPVGEILVEMGRITPDRVEKALERQSEAGGPGVSGVVARAVKVDTDKIDRLVGLAGELAVVKDEMLQMVRAAFHTGDVDHAWKKCLAQLTRITRELHDRSVALRMTPIRQVLQKITRLVRDANRKMNKSVNLVITGEDTELDKTVVEHLGDPLVHIVRNCLDHGIETAEERRAAGKPETAAVTLDTHCRGGHFVIRVTDDGRGLDRQGIMDKAVELGLLKEGANPTDADLHRLIFMPGFSTAKAVTDLSGRGVGLDVVRRNVEKLHGRIEMKSLPGKGTAVTISLPLTFAIISGMVVQTGGEEYIIPAAAVREAFHPRKEDLVNAGQPGEMVNVRGRQIPLVRLHRMLGIRPRTEDPCQATVILVENKGRRACLMADHLAGQKQIMIKNPEGTFSSIRGIADATVLGSGKVGLIIDVEGLLDRALKAE